MELITTYACANSHSAGKARSIILDCAMILLAFALGVFVRIPGASLTSISEEYRDQFLDETGTSYLLDPDSMLFARRAAEAAGISSTDAQDVTSIARTRAEDPLMTQARESEPGSLPNLLALLGAVALKIAGCTNGIDGTAANALSALAIILGILAAVPVFLFLRRRGALLGAFAGALLAVAAPQVVMHSSWGCFDTDCLLGVLPLSMMCCFAECCLARNRKVQYKWSALCTLFMLLIFFTWEAAAGYCLVLGGCACVLVLGAFTAYLLKKLPRQCLKDISIGAGIAVALCILVALACSVAHISDTFIATIKELFSSQLSEASYPSAATYVGELKQSTLFAGSSVLDLFKASGSGFVNRMGGVLPCVLALMGLAALISFLVSRRRAVSPGASQQATTDRGAFSANDTCGEPAYFTREQITALVILCVFGTWLIGTAVLATKGVRFFLLPALPLCVLFGFGVEAVIKLYQNAYARLTGVKHYVFIVVCMICCALIVALPFEKSNIYLAVVSCALFGITVILFHDKFPASIPLYIVVALLFAPASASYESSKGESAFVNDQMVASSDWIAENTSEDAVLYSWWDFGYFYQMQASRCTFLDGGTFDGQMYHWLSTALMTSDSSLSSGIMRMLSTSGLDAQDALAAYVPNATEQCALLESLLVMNRENATSYLTQQGIPEAAAQEIVALTHPVIPRDNYVVISRDMLSKLYAIDYYVQVRPESQAVASNVEFYSTKESVQIVADLDTTVSLLDQSNYRVRFTSDAGGAVNATLVDSDDSTCALSRAVVITDGRVTSDATYASSGYALVTIREGDRVSAALCTPSFCDSVMFRLFMLNTDTQGVFEKVHEESTPYGLLEEESSVQRKLGSALNRYCNMSGVVVWLAS